MFSRKIIPLPPADMGCADAVPLAFSADPSPQSGRKDFCLYQRGELSKGKHLTFLQTAQRQYCPVEVFHKLRLIAESGAIVRAGTADGVGSYRESDKAVRAQFPQELGHVDREAVAVAVSYEVRHTHPVVGAQGQGVT